ncbi:MAG: OadG family protein [Bacilli bacterium]|nr:OadG family protein [Bacilli bacterium]
MYQGIWPEGEFTFLDSLLVSLIAILLVFLVLIIIILVTHGVKLGTDKADSLTHINPKAENKLLDEDQDAVVAALTATIDFHKETGKNAELVSIERIDE